MNRWLLLIMILSVYLVSCTKSDNVAAQVKAQAAIDDKIVTAYLNKNSIPVIHIDTSGVCYTVDTLGSGSTLYSSATQVTVGYTGRVLNSDLSLGQVFAKTDSIHPSYTLGAVIRAWQLGIPKILQGGTITLYVPSRYAYGPYAQPVLNLQKNAIVIFHITLYSVIND